MSKAASADGSWALPEPTPSAKRPPVSSAAVAACDARLAGVQNGATVTDVPVISPGAAWAHCRAVMMPSREVTPPGAQPLE